MRRAGVVILSFFFGFFYEFEENKFFDFFLFSTTERDRKSDTERSIVFPIFV